MAAPNLNSATLTVTAAVDNASPANNTEATLTSNAASSGKTYITLSLTATNTTGTVANATVNWYDGTNNRYIGKTVPVGASGGVVEFAPRPKFLTENSSVKITSGTTSALDWVHHYVICS